jgi:hypothetical protein
MGKKNALLVQVILSGMAEKPGRTVSIPFFSKLLVFAEAITHRYAVLRNPVTAELGEVIDVVCVDLRPQEYMRRRIERNSSTEPDLEVI